MNIHLTTECTSCDDCHVR